LNSAVTLAFVHGLYHCAAHPLALAGSTIALLKLKCVLKYTSVFQNLFDSL